MPHADVNGVSLAYEVTGSGPWVVLLNGGGLDRRMWRPQAPALAEHFRVLSYDFRGAGESSTPATGYTRDNEQADLEALLAALGITRAHFVGLSMGAAVAQRFAIERPEIVISLVLAGGSTTPTPSDPAFDALLEQLPAIIAAEGPRAAQRFNLNGPLISISRSYANWPLIEAIMLSQPTARMMDPNRMSYPPPAIDVGARLSELSMPVLIIEGEHDLPGIRAKTQYLESVLPNVQSVLIRDAGHLSNLDQPEKFNEALLAFLVAQPRE